MKVYNYVCFTEITGKCKNYGKTVQLKGKNQKCTICNGKLKELGVATSIVHKGTQESKF